MLSNNGKVEDGIEILFSMKFQWLSNTASIVLTASNTVKICTLWPFNHFDFEVVRAKIVNESIKWL